MQIAVVQGDPWPKTLLETRGGRSARLASNGQIASRLNLTEATVKRHLRNIFVKLGAVSRLDAVNKAKEWRRHQPAAVPRQGRPGNGPLNRRASCAIALGASGNPLLQYASAPRLPLGLPLFC